MGAKDEVANEEAILRSSLGSGEGNGAEDLEYELEELEDTHVVAPLRPRWMRGRRHLGQGSRFFAFNAPRRRRSFYHRMIQLLSWTSFLISSMILGCGMFFPSYSDPPRHYVELRQRAMYAGVANVNNEKVFIAASLYDPEGELLGGQWARSVSQLIEILGPENVFLSIYENDPDGMAQAALTSFARDVPCPSEITTESLDLRHLPHLIDMDGIQRLKRIEFLAEVRNRALRPLRNTTSPAYSVAFDKLLYLNDVIFDPIDAANLLLSTNLDDKTGHTNYLAACAVDFINPFKFYDTYATRDLTGYTMGVPFYPWFTGASTAESRSDVLVQKDAVRVKSCWGGMVAFEAKWFQPNQHSARLSSDISTTTNGLGTLHNGNQIWNDMHDPLARSSSPSNTSALLFRAEMDTFWDASECCLIHADLSFMASSTLGPGETGIYMNPYIRVAYTASVLPWLSITKRFERLYPPIQTMVNWLANRPTFNPRQFQEPGNEVINRVWQWDTKKHIEEGKYTLGSHPRGHFAEVTREALPGGFCGLRKLSYMNEDHTEGDGSSKWINGRPPTVG